MSKKIKEELKEREYSSSFISAVSYIMKHDSSSSISVLLDMWMEEESEIAKQEIISDIEDLLFDLAGLSYPFIMSLAPKGD